MSKFTFKKPSGESLVKPMEVGFSRIIVNPQIRYLCHDDIEKNDLMDQLKKYTLGNYKALEEPNFTILPEELCRSGRPERIFLSNYIREDLHPVVTKINIGHSYAVVIPKQLMDKVNEVELERVAARAIISHLIKYHIDNNLNSVNLEKLKEMLRKEV